MRNVRTSLIVGVLIVELVFGAFLLSQKSHRSTVDTDVTTNSSAQWAATSPQLGDTHVAAGSVIGATALSGNTATGAGQSTSGIVAAQSDSPVQVAAQAPRPDTRPREPVAVRAYAEPRTNPPSRTESRHDSLQRRGLNPVASAMTDELVKESAKLDPALPPPSPSASALPLPPPDQPGRNNADHSGSNPVAAAMTEQLVRALPPPDQSGVK
jgi:hypothetical protein